MSTRPKAFSDLADLRDLRSPEEREADRLAAAAQSAALVRQIERERALRARVGVRGLVDPAVAADRFALLQSRRAPLPGVAPVPTDDDQFEVDLTQAGGRSLFARDQVVARRGTVQRPTPAPALDNGSFTLDNDLAASCPELAERLARYVAAAPAEVDRSGEVAATADAARVGVSLLHVVIKSTPPQPLPITVPPPPARPLTASQAVVVAVIDTGITDEVRKDGWLTDVSRTGVVDPLDVFPKPENGRLDFGAGHGTFIAGIIRQVDPQAEIRMYRAMDSDGVGSEIKVACAMIQAAKDGADVLNLSLGGNTIDGQPSVVYEAALDVIDEISAGRPGRPVIVAAAGNSGDREPVWPAASGRVVAVAGLTADGEGAEWSSRGPWVNVSTIGEGIVSTYVEGRTEDFDVDGDGDVDPSTAVFGLNSWAMWSGTSFAAAQLSGAIARRSREADLTPQAAADELIAGGTEIDGDFGRGLEILAGT